MRAAALANEVGVKHALHSAVDVVGKATDIEALDKTRRLNNQCDGKIEEHQHSHCPGGPVTAENVGKALGKPPLKPRRCQQPDVVKQSGKRDKGKRQPFDAEIGADPVRSEVFLGFHMQIPPFTG